MKILLPVALSLLATTASQAVTITDTIVGSDIYPGTVHTVEVIVPDSYDGRTPAALYLGLDGQLLGAPVVIDSLMACGRMPVTIGVYLQPGFIPGKDGRILRYNRSNEFDATDARFATFLETELLPRVEKMSTPDGRRVRLTRDPRQRMISGLSSGGIASFVAAWHRPDLFGRVFSGCGTFVPMRGGDALAGIVRKHERQPLRVFLQDGFDDCWNEDFGSWFDANANLASALRRQGYDLRVDWAEGVHSVRRGTEIFPEMMEWMWRDTPLPPSDALSWQEAEPETYNAPDSTALYPDGSLGAQILPDSNYLMQFIVGDDDSHLYHQPFYWLHNYTNSELQKGGMAYDGKGNLWVVTDAGLQICDQNGRVRRILAIPRDGARAALRIEDGRVILITPDHTFTRTIPVKAARKGVTPPSQGQA